MALIASRHSTVNCMHLLLGFYVMIILQEPEKALIARRERLFKDRRDTLLQACEQQNTLRSKPFFLNSAQFFVAVNHEIVYCNIPKVGSTFWKRILQIVENKKTFASLYEFRNSDVKMPVRLIPAAEFRSSMNKSAYESFLEEATSFLFVREPYGRIFSAYNNKILNPNIFYWRIIGRNVVKVVRENPSQESLEYGHDVTFAEMIKYLLYLYGHRRAIDRHFNPMSRKCDPCQMRYEYIGKMETFADDAKFIIAKMREKYQDVNIKFEEFDKETALDTAKGHTGFLFGVLKATQGITYPIHNFFLRTWRDLQVRGFLSKHIDMPLTSDETANITREEFFDVIKQALMQPMNQTEVKKQRNEAMMQAYRSIPLEDMLRLAKYVETDCLLFGYDPRPAMLFDREQFMDTEAFNYFDAI